MPTSMVTHIFTSGVIFCEQSAKFFVTMATCLRHIWVGVLNSPTLKISGRVQAIGTYLPYKLSYSQFCVQCPSFR